MRVLLLVLFGFVSLTVSEIRAQTLGVAGAVGFLHTSDIGNGATVSAGVTVSTRFVELSVTPVDLGIMSPDPNGRYQSEALSNGNTVCRDQQTGQFASESNCGPRYIYAASTDVLFAIPVDNQKSLALGGGYRAGNSSGPYGSGALYFGPVDKSHWLVKARAGQKFFDFVIAGVFRLNK